MPSPSEPGRPCPRDPLSSWLEEEARQGSWPGACWIVEESGVSLSEGAVGQRALVPEPSAASPATIYDLASLTKPLATGALLAILEAEGRIDLEAPAADWLPGLACARGGRPTLLDLALHRSGLPAWRPFFAAGSGREAILDGVMRCAAEAPCGERVLYSDVGYTLLGAIVERAGAAPIDRLFRTMVTERLGIETVAFGVPAGLMAMTAPTELGNAHEIAMARADAEWTERIEPFAIRDGLIRGEVHDSNAFALGGVAGHAGLFGDARGVARLAREFLGPAGGGTGLFGRRALELFGSNLTPGLEEGRSLGWKRASRGAREAEGVLPAAAFGHAGFTGTSVWLDPTERRVYVLLTNRIHPCVTSVDMTGLRRRFHEIARGAGREGGP